MGVDAGLYDVVVKKFTFPISSPDEFLLRLSSVIVSLGLLLHHCFLCYDLSLCNTMLS